mgnify:CR=1 FL=1
MNQVSKGDLMKKIFFALISLLLLTSCDLLLPGYLDGNEVNPKDIPDLLLWFKADAGVMTGGTGCSDATGDANNNENVSCWKDQSGNGYHAQQANAPNRPILSNSVGVFGGQKALKFTEANNEKLYNMISVPYSYNITLITVSYTDTYANVGPTQVIFKATHFYHEVYTGIYNSYFKAPNIIGGSYQKPVIFATTHDDSNYEMRGYFNGKKLETKVGTVSSATNTTIHIGCDESSSYLNGYIAEILVYNRALSEKEIQELNTYLGKKYNIKYEGD